MNILILRKIPNWGPVFPEGRRGGADYQADMLLHGFRNMFGNSVVDHNRSWWIYSGDFGPGKLDDSVHKGWTIYRSLGDDSGVDRTDIENKIQTHFFDLIVFGYVQYGIEQTYWDLAQAHYDPKDIIFLDGMDGTDIDYSRVGKCLYFKRELAHPIDQVYPVSFAIPDEKIDLYPSNNKTHIVAPMDPRNPASYIYKQEPEYYQQYAESLFGVTTKKGGWDCMRHYEILANNCIPWFLDLEDCPDTTMTSLPKQPMLEVVRLMREKGESWFATNEGFEHWIHLNDEVQTHFRQYCTTSALAKHVLDTRSSV